MLNHVLLDYCKRCSSFKLPLIKHFINYITCKLIEVLTSLVTLNKFI